jgi:hypothetical protein
MSPVQKCDLNRSTLNYKNKILFFSKRGKYYACFFRTLPGAFKKQKPRIAAGFLPIFGIIAHPDSEQSCVRWVIYSP